MRLSAKREKSCSVISVCVLLCALIVIQFSDSYCAELYEKIQSLFLKDLLMEPKGIGLDDATILLNGAAIPFYIISALAPLACVLVDYVGKKKVLVINFLILIAGLATCMLARNWILFLLGNAVVAFGCSVDIQYIYIVDELKENVRATVRGLLAAIAAISAVCVSIVRKLLVDGSPYSWTKLYLLGILIAGAVALFSLFVLKKDEKKAAVKEKRTDFQYKSKNKNILKDLSKSGILTYLIPLFFWGLAVPGVTFYNEPLAALTLGSEDTIWQALFIQPIATIIITISSGFFADRTKRYRIVTVDAIIACIGMLWFLLQTILQNPSSVQIGAAWGMMTGGYFSATNLMLLAVTEYAGAERVGRIFALSSYVNGAGTAAGMVFISILSKILDAKTAKLLMCLPPCIIAVSVLHILNRRTGKQPKLIR